MIARWACVYGWIAIAGIRTLFRCRVGRRPTAKRRYVDAANVAAWRVRTIWVMHSPDHSSSLSSSVSVSAGQATDRSAAASAVSGHLDTRTAAMEIAEAVHESLRGRCDLAIVQGSFHHTAAFTDAAQTVQRMLSPRVLLGGTAESVLGAGTAREGLPGLSLLAVRAAGMHLHPFYATPDEPLDVHDALAVRERLQINNDHQLTLLFADPFSAPINQMLPAITTCRGDNHPAPVAGAMVSGASQPGGNVLIVNEHAFRHGVVGVTIAGDVSADVVVSQGCRPIGPSFVITRCEDNVIHQVGGRPTLRALQDMAEHLTESQRQYLSRGLLIGFVIDEYKSHFGRDDFLIRNVLNVNEDDGSLTVAETPRVGQTIQFHVRDASTAREDLNLLLDAQQLKPKPLAGMLFTCNGRTERLFDEPGHDLSLVRQRLGDVPLGGMYAAGEIGPIGGRSFVHGHTASLVLLRPRS